ncbi:MAG: YIP1 family protein [Bacteroidales bacterium]|nr:YIP1 family protein [Bacteroidales bacterium]
MDFKFLYHRTINLIIRPEMAWKIIHTENRPITDIRGSFFLPLVSLTAVSAFFGSLFFTHGGLSLFYPVFMAARYFLLFLTVTYISAIILNEITNALDLGKDFVRAFKLIGYSLAPLYICQIISLLFESLLFVNLLSLYSLYIFWIGMEKMTNPPEHKKMPLMIATWASFAAVYVTVNWLLRTLIDGIYFSIFG